MFPPDSSPRRLAGLIRRLPWLRSAFRRLHRLLPDPVGNTLAQWVVASVHEPDFHLFEWVRQDSGLLLDVGANRGNAAVSVLRNTAKFRVVSLEPNPALRWSLWIIRLLHPLRFRFRLVGAGAEDSQQVLLIPQANTDLSSQASLDSREFRKPYVRERLADDGHGGPAGRFRRVPVRLRRVDDLGYRPDVVKIDVEGWELQVLEGMPELLRNRRPLLIIERNNCERWAPLLEQQGYRFYSYAGDGQLVQHAKWADVPGLNMVCAHPRSGSAIARKLLLAATGGPNLGGREGEAAGGSA